MKTVISSTKASLGVTAGKYAAESIRTALVKKGSVNIILATGASQFEMLETLTSAPDIDWSGVSMFHLDEYVGMPINHPASFRKYLKERFVDKVAPLRAAYFVEGDASDPAAECKRLGALIHANPIDVAMVGIGENGHLAFNDPPADFHTEEPYILVNLDEACRKQQFGEGWFPTMDDVPRQAISMSIRQIMKSARIVCTVPDERKAVAVKGALEGPLTNMCPSSILREHLDCTIFLDTPAASLLTQRDRYEWQS